MKHASRPLAVWLISDVGQIMTPRTGFLGLYWGPRPVSVEAAAGTCARGFDELAHAGLTSFYLKDGSKKEALRHPFNPTVDEIRELLSKGRNRRDTDQSVIEELGFSFSLWSGGAEGESYTVSVLIGASSKFVKNCFVLGLPALGHFSLSARHHEYEGLSAKLSTIFAPDSTELKFHN